MFARIMLSPHMLSRKAESPMFWRRRARFEAIAIVGYMSVTVIETSIPSGSPLGAQRFADVPLTQLKFVTMPIEKFDRDRRRDPPPRGQPRLSPGVQTIFTPPSRVRVSPFSAHSGVLRATG
jgi:hypothetical protein